MAGFSTGRRLIWIPVAIALGATTLTGCKKTIHAVKPLTNISQAPTASQTSAATTVASASASASATANTPSAVAILSATAVPAVPAATPAANGGKGCALISVDAVAKVLGVASISSVTEAATTLRAPIVAHQGCRYVAGAAGAGWDLNTFSAPPPQALIAAEVAKVPGAQQTTIDGLPAFTAPIPGATAEEEASVYKGDESLVILSHGKPGAAVALAKLILAAL